MGSRDWCRASCPSLNMVFQMVLHTNCRSPHLWPWTCFNSMLFLFFLEIKLSSKLYQNENWMDFRKLKLIEINFRHYNTTMLFVRTVSKWLEHLQEFGILSWHSSIFAKTIKTRLQQFAILLAIFCQIAKKVCSTHIFARCTASRIHRAFSLPRAPWPLRRTRQRPVSWAESSRGAKARGS